MSLVKCSECSKPISDKAIACPHCGHPTSFEYGPSGDLSILAEPEKKKRSASDSVVGFIVLAIIFAAIVFHNSSSDKTPPSPPVVPTCKSDWRLCSDNADLINHYSGISDAQVACMLNAEKLAKYGTPDFPWSSFGRFYDGISYLKSGVITLVETGAQFSNGFGAMVHSTVTCTYDLVGKRVTDNIISPN
jgi:hypothetical protein